MASLRIFEFCSETSILLRKSAFRFAASRCQPKKCFQISQNRQNVIRPLNKTRIFNDQGYKTGIINFLPRRYQIRSRWYSTSAVLWTYRQRRNAQNDKQNKDFAIYIVSILIFMIGVSYAAVPLYRLFCQATGLGGDPKLGHNTDLVETMEPIRERRITVYFNADHHAAMQWNFKPSQKRITVVPGETALAFYTAKNPTDKPIVGIATYNVVPFQAGLYFNKIQCFCFEEQWLNPHEEVDMPVFFYIDPEFDSDPQLANVNDIVLSYTFFKAEEGQKLPLPGFMNLNSVQAIPQAAPQ